MGTDAIRQTVIDPTDLDLRLEDLETAFDVGQGFATFEDSGRRTESPSAAMAGLEKADGQTVQRSRR